MTDIQSSPSPTSELHTATQEPVRPANEPALDSSPDTFIVIKRATLYYATAGFLFVVLAFVAGFMIGTASTAGTVQAVRQAVATSLAGLSANNTGNVAAAQPQQPTEDPNVRFSVDVAGSPSLGPTNAPVTIVEFSDFQCPFCEAFFTQTETPLLTQYAGKIRFVYRNFPLSQIHPYALGAAEAAQCAYDQNKFWEYHNLLFQNQQKLTKPDFLAYATQLKLDMTTFQSCVDGNKDDAKVQTDLQTALGMNLSGTPTFFINGRMLVGAQPLSTFIRYIDAELANPGLAASAASTPGR